MDVGEGAEELIHIQLDLEHGHWLLKFGIMAACAIYSFGDIFEY